MAAYAIDGEKLIMQTPNAFGDLNILERADLQRLLRQQQEVLGEELMIISEEFGNWEDSKRRIDLLALDRSARLVVIELKRTVDGGHMELQAIRYAAMVSAMTFDEVVPAYSSYRALHDANQEGHDSVRSGDGLSILPESMGVFRGQNADKCAATDGLRGSGSGRSGSLGGQGATQ